MAASTGILRSRVSIYEFSLEDVKHLICTDLNVSPNSVTVEYVIQEVGGDPMDRFPGHKQVTGVRVTVTNQVPLSKLSGG